MVSPYLSAIIATQEASENVKIFGGFLFWTPFHQWNFPTQFPSIPMNLSRRVFPPTPVQVFFRTPLKPVSVSGAD